MQNQAKKLAATLAKALGALEGLPSKVIKKKAGEGLAGPKSPDDHEWYRPTAAGRDSIFPSTGPDFRQAGAMSLTCSHTAHRAPLTFAKQNAWIKVKCPSGCLGRSETEAAGAATEAGTAAAPSQPWPAVWGGAGNRYAVHSSICLAVLHRTGRDGGTFRLRVSETLPLSSMSQSVESHGVVALNWEEPSQANPTGPWFAFEIEDGSAGTLVGKAGVVPLAPNSGEAGGQNNYNDVIQQKLTSVLADLKQLNKKLKFNGIEVDPNTLIELTDGAATDATDDDAAATDAGGGEFELPVVPSVVDSDPPPPFEDDAADDEVTFSLPAAFDASGMDQMEQVQLSDEQMEEVMAALGTFLGEDGMAGKVDLRMNGQLVDIPPQASADDAAAEAEEEPQEEEGAL